MNAFQVIISEEVVSCTVDPREAVTTKEGGNIIIVEK